MPRLTLLGASALACLAAGCSRGHVATHVPTGLAYECDHGGALSIRFNGGGYQPESDVRAVVNGAPSEVRVPRSTAEVEYGGRRLRMLPEYTERGLRYRSEARYDGAHYLIWTQRGEAGDAPELWTNPGAPRGAEDVQLGHRRTLEPQGENAIDGERMAEGEPIALCRRKGRASGNAAEPSHRR
jgi:hypothetical protein